MKRILLAQVQLDAQGARTPAVPASTTAWVSIADWPNRNRMLVKATLPDLTPKTANTIADITMEDVLDDQGNVTGQKRQVDINDEPLTPTQINTAKTQLTNAGFNISQFDTDGVVSRAQLLRFILRRLAQWQGISWRDLLDGWDA